tara:strand:- start:171 stop:494 length:324 start_codon:yes stop_codon:yes gene_type:complete
MRVPVDVLVKLACCEDAPLTKPIAAADSVKLDDMEEVPTRMPTPTFTALAVPIISDVPEPMKIASLVCVKLPESEAVADIGPRPYWNPNGSSEKLPAANISHYPQSR